MGRKAWFLIQIKYQIMTQLRGLMNKTRPIPRFTILAKIVAHSATNWPKQENNLRLNIRGH